MNGGWIITIAVIAALIGLELLHQHRARKQKAQRQQPVMEQAANPVVAAPPRPEPVRSVEAAPAELPVPPPEPALRPAEPTPATEPDAPVDMLSIQRMLQDIYRRTYAKLSIPTGARMVDRMVDVFSLRRVPVTHYCWKAGGVLYAFPTWESVEYQLAVHSGWADRFGPRDENRLCLLRLPLVQVRDLEGRDGGGNAALIYRDRDGRDRELLFLGEHSVEALQQLVPGKLAPVEERKAYLRSPRHIEDLKQEIGLLRAQLAEGVITKEAYDRQKTALLLTL